MEKKANEPKAKGGVKFADPKTPVVENVVVEEPVKAPIPILDMEECKKEVLEIFNEVDAAFKRCTKNDPDVKRKDTAKALNKILERLKLALTYLNQQNTESKEKTYYLTYNATIYVFEVCRALRKSVYSSLTLQYLAYSILSLESSLNLLGIKFLDWRIKLYIELAHIYDQSESYKASAKTIDTATQKVNELKEIEDSDAPVPEHVSSIIENNFRILRALEVKYKLQTGGLNADAWKKKIEDYFKKDIEGRNLAIIESLNLNYKKHANIITHAGTQFPWKDQVLTFSYEMVKDDIAVVTKALSQLDEKMAMSMRLREEVDPGARNELAGQIREYDNNMIMERAWKKASQNVPIELHIELLKQAYDLKSKLYGDLLQTALVRCQHRRVEVPYIVDIQLLESPIAHPNIPNGYEKVPIDINDAHLKAELAQLRVSIVKEIAKQQEEKRQEKLNDMKMSKARNKQGELEVTREKPPHPSTIEVDPANVTHNYMFFLIKRSHNPENAIYAIDVVMADEDEGPVELKNQGWRTIKIPVDQYTGVRETTKMTPFLCLKHSTNSLRDEEEKKSLVVDFLPILGKSYLARPRFGFDKIAVDLRQVPQQFYKLPNLDFVYISYKADKMFYICEKELYILKCLDEVEKTYKGSKTNSEEEEIRAYLDVNYDLYKLKELAQTIKQALDGPLGDYFFESRKDFLVKFAFYIWKKYLVSSLHQIDTAYELRITEEINGIEFRKYDTLLETMKDVFIDILEAINQIMTKTEIVDIVWIARLSIELCKLLEERGDFRKAAQLLRFANNKLIEFKDQLFARGVESKKDVFLPLTITCDNAKINDMIEEMKNTYYSWKSWLRKEIRAQRKEKEGLRPLDQDEAHEEDYEFKEIVHFYARDDLKDSQYLESLNFDKAFTEYYGIVNALHTDVTANLIRCEVKAGKYSQNQTMLKQTDKLTLTLKNPEGIENIPERLRAKMTIMAGKTAKQIHKNATTLQTTLQNAGKQEPPKPKVENYENELLQEGNNNSYFNALLYMTMATNKSKFPEQKYLLKEAFKYILQAEEEEKMHILNGIENAVFLFSTLLDDKNAEKASTDYYPFNFIYNTDYIKPSEAPRKPILISRSTSSITLKLPPFEPIIPETLLLANPNLKTVTNMALFGKASQHGVSVSATSNDLQNTGTRVSSGAIVTVGKLRMNEKYCFAAAGYDPREKIINNEIGQTGEDIATVLPLPLNLLYSHLAMIAYQLDDFELSEEAAEKAGYYFHEETGIKERSLDYSDNPIYIHRIKHDAIKNYSLNELRVAATNYIILARCLQRKFAKQESQAKSMSYIAKQKNVLVVCNYLLLALELCSMSKSYAIGKKIVKELYNDVLPFFSFRTKSKFIFHILLRVQLLISQIPKEIWDSNLRNCSIKVTYELLKMTLQFNEVKLSKLVLYYDSKLPHKKWFIISKTIMVEEAALHDAKDDKKKGAGKDTKKSAKGLRPKEEEKVDPNEPPKLVPKLVREIAEKTTLEDNLEEFLLSLGEEYYDSVSNFIELWKEQLETFKPYIDNGTEIIDQRKSDLTTKFDFWDLLRDHAQAFAKIQQNYKGTPFYMEFACKYIKKAVERRVEPKELIEQMKQITEIENENILSVNQILDLKLQAIEGDIGWNPNLLEELILEREINKVGEDQAIDIYTRYWKNFKELQEKAFTNKEFYYEMKWLSEFNLLRGIIHYLSLYGQLKEEIENRYEVFFDIKEMDLESLNQSQEEGGHGDAGQSFVMIDGARITELTTIMKYLCKASMYALAANTTYLLQNLVKVVFNILKIEMITPFDHKNTDFYKYSVLLSQNLVSMLEIYKDEVKMPGGVDSSPFFELALSRQLDKREETERKSADSKHYLLDTKLTKDFWFTKESLDIATIANVTAYCIQTLTVENKMRVLVEDSKHFCNTVQHHFSLEVLPFTVFAQKRLYEQAKEQTNAKIKQLEERTKAFEEWKAANRRRRTRQAMLTGEIPPEQIEYEKDAEELNRQIQIYKHKENFLNTEKATSEDVLYQLKRDVNQVLESLNQTRKLLARYGQGMKEIEQEERIDQIDQKVGRRNKVLSQTLITKYQIIIEQLKKKQENVALIQALHELGNLNFSTENLLAAIDNWNDSLDTIFQKFETLKSFREVIANYKTLGFQLGIQKCLIGGIVLYKLANYCYFNSIHMQRECVLMAYEMVSAIFRTSLPHHFISIDFGSYRVKELLDKEDIFSNKYVLNPAEVLVACSYHATYLIDIEKHVNALPFLGLMEYIATDIVMSPYYSVKAKVLKSICLSALGYINESYMLLAKVLKEKDLPISLVKNSEYTKKEHGYNYTPDSINYINQYSPYDDRNNNAIENITKLELASNFKFKYGFVNYNLFYFAKAALIFTIYDVENYEKVDLNDRRFNRLAEAEGILRVVLKRISFEENLSSKTEELSFAQNKVQFEDNNESKDKVTELKNKVIEFMTTSEIDASEHEAHLKHKEAALKYAEAREERVAMIMRIRYLLSSINNAMNFTTRSYYILKQAIINLKLYSEDRKDIETGEDTGNTSLEFKSTDEKGGKGDAKAKKEAKKETKDTKKDTKKDSKKPNQPPGQDDEKKQAELEKRLLEEELSNLRQKAEERPGRNIFNGFWWIKLRTDFCHILCKQNKLEECLALIDLFKKDCIDLKDTFFVRTLHEIEAKVLLKQGKTEESLEKYQKVIQQVKTHHHDDIGSGKIFGDYADILFQRGKTEEAEIYYRAARAVFVNLLHEVRYEFYPQNINKQALAEEVRISDMLQLPSDVENNIMKSDRFKGKKDEKKGGKDDKKKLDPKGKGKVEVQERVDEMNISPLLPLPDYDYLKENKYNFLLIEDKQVSNQLPFIYSLKPYEYYIKATLNQVRCNLYKEDSKWDQQLVVKALDDVNTIIQNIYQTPISSKYLFNFLYGKAWRRKFIEDLLKIHREYEEKYTKQKIKKYRKLHSRVPYRDFLRNQYMIDIPGFGEALKETLLPYLDKSKEYLKKAADLLKSECLLFENGIKVEEVFTELCEVCLYMREYRPRPNFKYYMAEDLESISKEKGIEDITDFSKHLEELVDRNKKQCDDLEWEAYSYLLYSIQTSQSKFQLQDNFSTIGLSNLLVPEKIPTDIYNMIIESDYQQKKTYESKLFDDSKRKTIVSSIDVLVFLNRLARESSILSFSGINNQKIISRLHRYTSVHLSTYAQKCVLQKTEVQLRANLALSPLPEGNIIAKLSQNSQTKEHKLVYMLGALNKEKLQATVKGEDVNKIIINAENEVLYGSLYFEDLELSQLLQYAFDLKSRMEVSDKKSEEAKERDYRRHRFDFESLITRFGLKFKDKASKDTKDQSRTSIASNVEAEVDPEEFLDKYKVMVPDLTKENINLFIGLFDGIGLSVVNFNYLALFRHFHSMKYR